MKNLFTVRKTLSFFLLLSVVLAGITTYYKIEHWGFSFYPQEKSDVWTVDAHISFIPTGEPIEVSLSTPKIGEEYKILSEEVIAKGYTTSKNENPRRLKMTSSPKKNKQNLYYRIMIYDNEDATGKVRDNSKPKAKSVEYTDDLQRGIVEEIWNIANNKEGGSPAMRIIELLNEQPLNPVVDAFLPVKKTSAIMADRIMFLLATKGIASRIVRGVTLKRKKRAAKADLMLEVYEGSKWMLYNIETAEVGLPKNFIIFQRGGVSLLDVSGGRNSEIEFSVIKSAISSFKMANRRAKYENSRLFNYSIYNLPMQEQNVLKWLMIFPLGILLVVIMRNIVGIQTMGTFTPMLIAMSLIRTGFVPGLICFSIIIALGLLIRTMLTRLNLLLVPRISAVVIFVILIMQTLTIFGYVTDFRIAVSAVFFPIIITAWIIERACITWEEEGAKNASKQIINTVIVAIFTYLIISSEYIRQLMFAFNEWNLVILFIVMLLGTYTGYRLNELKRFAPLIKEK